LGGLFAFGSPRSVLGHRVAHKSLVHSVGIQRELAYMQANASRLPQETAVTGLPRLQLLARPDVLAAPVTTSRRAVLTGSLGLAAATATLPLGSAFAQKKPAGPDSVPLDELMKAGELSELSIGPADAKVTIVEYASMTCGHCANFHNKVLPDLKTKYVDTGKVRFIFREFPLEDFAAAGSMLARCSGGDKTLPLIGILFQKQEQWAFVGASARVAKLFEIAKQAGFTQDSFDKCLTDQKLLDQVNGVRNRASEKFAVQSTPTFFINGQRMTASPTVAEFEKLIEPLLKG
jgi:protein-disulfide isomerase